MKLIRQALEPDVSAIECPVKEAYSHYIPRVGKPPGPMSDNYHLLVEKQCVWVLVLDEEILGLLVLVPKPDHMLLDNVAIKPARQRSGLGRYLISFAEEHTRHCGYRQIVLYTNEAMYENLDLYTRLGYEVFWRGHEHGFDRANLRKQL